MRIRIRNTGYNYVTICLDNLVERGEKLELLVDKTENLSASAVSFKTASTNLQRKMW
jgi:hypothetical protein